MMLPISLLMGIYLQFVRPGKVLEGSLIGFVLLLAALFGGRMVSQNPEWAPLFTFTGATLALIIIVYGFIASTLPVWLVLAAARLPGDIRQARRRVSAWPSASSRFGLSCRCHP